MYPSSFHTSIIPTYQDSFRTFPYNQSFRIPFLYYQYLIPPFRKRVLTTWPLRNRSWRSQTAKKRKQPLVEMVQKRTSLTLRSFAGRTAKRKVNCRLISFAGRTAKRKVNCRLILLSCLTYIVSWELWVLSGSWVMMSIGTFKFEEENDYGNEILL